MDFSDKVNQHKALASGGTLASGDFGMKAHASSRGANMASEALAKAGHMGDGARAAAPPVRHMKRRMRAQANPDHGAHSGGRMDSDGDYDGD